MLVLEPIVHETIWGGPRLTPLTTTGETQIGHLYSVYARKELSNKILNGVHAGKTLQEVRPDFPLTIALTEADKDLSLQVHPDDEAAQKLEQLARGKRESWYFLEAPASGSLVNGCCLKDMEAIRTHVAENDYEGVLDYLPVTVGDYVFVEPGTLHAISAGSLVYEIEQGADFTYRFYDYDRVDAQGKKRELHTEKALACLHPELKSVVRQYREGSPIVEATYATQLHHGLNSYENKQDKDVCFTLLKGQGKVDGVELRPGMTVILSLEEKIAELEAQEAMTAWLTI
jgi:mannose-6-phosphate isomerase